MISNHKASAATGQENLASRQGVCELLAFGFSGCCKDLLIPRGKSQVITTCRPYSDSLDTVWTWAARRPWSQM